MNYFSKDKKKEKRQLITGRRGGLRRRTSQGGTKTGRVKTAFLTAFFCPFRLAKLFWKEHIKQITGTQV